ncbi:MAG: NTP transferase domain-containing protein [Candidatus Cloacimonetes bacterium]|nr:NTP transferase domain-containing protein [Candidatus Cloacimonadota bacterium]
MIALIMAGGVGTRFWPLSRNSKPKQFLKILSEKSMLQITVDRLLPKIRMEDIYVVTAQSQVELTKKHLPQLPEENIIIEPFGMNTAPCIALSAQYLARKYDKSEKMIVLPADHLIARRDDFLNSLEIGEISAEKDNLVTFGIKPDYPATGYGYIEAGEKIDDQCFFVKQFKEKPDLETAESFLKAGNFFWNSGMFMWKIETILKAFQDYLSKVTQILEKIENKWNTKGLTADISYEYSGMPKVPVDVGIMEKAEKRVVILVDYGWSDVGSWKALYDISQKDENNNVLKCKNEIIESKNNYVNSEKFVALVGVENMIVIDSGDALLIADKSCSEDVKKIVEKLKKDGKEELL